VNDVPEVVEFYRISGDVDYLPRVVVPNIAAYDAVYKRLRLNGRGGRALTIAKLTRRHTLFTVH